MASAKFEVILKGPDDWTKWDREFQTRAITKRLWNYITENTALLEEPVMPEADSYKTPIGPA